MSEQPATYLYLRCDGPAPEPQSMAQMQADLERDVAAWRAQLAAELSRRFTPKRSGNISNAVACGCGAGGEGVAYSTRTRGDAMKTAEEIVRALAASEPTDGDGQCVLIAGHGCGGIIGDDPRRHDAKCPYRMAREWVEADLRTRFDRMPPTDYVRCRRCDARTHGGCKELCVPFNKPEDLLCPCGDLREAYDCQNGRFDEEPAK